MVPDPGLVDRFACDLDALVPDEVRLGIAVSGGPDSLALLLLAAAARPARIRAATVDHGLRVESAAEAHRVGSICSALGVPHDVLQPAWTEIPEANLQAAARDARYQQLLAWARRYSLGAVATAHHADDQAETLLMRLNRGAGVAGLAGARVVRVLGTIVEQPEVQLVRPLLGWRRDELHAIVRTASVDAVSDPTNADERFDRTHARRLLRSDGWLGPVRLAASAAHCAEAEEALDWAAVQELERRQTAADGAITIDPSGLPPELQRRLLLKAIEAMGAGAPPGPKLSLALATLRAGRTTTIAGLKLEGGSIWRLSPAPPRRG